MLSALGVVRRRASHADALGRALISSISDACNTCDVAPPASPIPAARSCPVTTSRNVTTSSTVTSSSRSLGGLAATMRAHAPPCSTAGRSLSSSSCSALQQPSHAAGIPGDAAAWHAFARQRGSTHKQEEKPGGGKGEDGKQGGKKEEEEDKDDKDNGDEEEDENVHEHFPLMVRRSAGCMAAWPHARMAA